MPKERAKSTSAITQIVLSLGRGGLETMAVDLAIGLAESGVRASVIALDEGGVLETRLRDANVEYVVLNGRRFKDPRFHLSLAAQLRRLKTGVVHSHMFAPLFHSLPAIALGGVRRIVHTEHSFEYLEQRASLRHALRWMSRATHAFTLVGKQMLPFYVDMVGVSEGRLRVIPNGIDTERYNPNGNQATVRAEFGIPIDAFVIGSAGRLAPEKNYALLLAAAAQCHDAGISTHVVLFGDGDERAALSSTAAQLGLEGSVSFLGWRSDMYRLLCALDVFVLTSESEGLPLALLEAMAAGLPIVSTPVGDIPLLVAEGKTGHLVARGNASGFASRLRQLAENSSARRCMGTAARAAVVDGYSQATMIRQYLDAYGF